MVTISPDTCERGRGESCMAEEIRISSEEDAWRLLEQLLNSSGETPPPDRISISGWQPELLFFPDGVADYVVLPATARAISEFHATLQRAFAHMAYGEPNASRLRNEDKEKLELRILVKKGSNGYNVQDHALEFLLNGLVNKMSGEQITLSVVTFLLLYFSGVFGKHWLSLRAQEKRDSAEISARVSLSQEETKRAEIMATALSRRPDMQPVSDIADDGRAALVRGVTRTTRGRVMGTEITGEEARQLISKPKEERTGTKIDGYYEVIKLETENPDGFYGKLRNIETGAEFDIEMDYNFLTDEDISVIFSAAKQKSKIFVVANAWLVGGRISRAMIMRAYQRNPDGNG